MEQFYLSLVSPHTSWFYVICLWFHGQFECFYRGINDLGRSGPKYILRPANKQSSNQMILNAMAK